MEESTKETRVMTLMHRDHPVLTAEVDAHSGNFTKLLEVHDAAHLPVAARCFWEKGRIGNPITRYKTLSVLDFWREMRLIPQRRTYNYERFIKFSSRGELSLHAHMANLSDAYWIKAENEDLTYDKVSFHRVPFESFFVNKENLVTPDFTTNGNITKYWDVRDDKRLLYKASYHRQSEPYNEVIASEFAERLGLPHVPYIVEKREDEEAHEVTYSVCEAFTSDLVEYVPAWEIRGAAKKNNSENDYGFFLRCGKVLGLPDFRQDLDNILAFDFIINNEDRHYGNFGFLRNAETLEWLGLAPIFDNGNSLWFFTDDREIRYGEDYSKPFRQRHSDQLRLTKSRLNLSGLLKEDIETLLGEHLDEVAWESRIKSISYCVNKRVETLAKWQEIYDKNLVKG